jgi:hypothetical protein
MLGSYTAVFRPMAFEAIGLSPAVAFTVTPTVPFPAGGVVGGVLLGDELAGGDCAALGEVLGRAVVGPVEGTAPVQVVPFKVKEAGTGLDCCQVPLNPKLAEPPVAMAAL